MRLVSGVPVSGGVVPPLPGQRQTAFLRAAGFWPLSHVCADPGAQKHSLRRQVPLHSSEGAETIEFRMNENIVRIEISLEVAERAQLKISSSLLAHATKEIGWLRGNGNVVL